MILMWTFILCILSFIYLLQLCQIGNILLSRMVLMTEIRKAKKGAKG